MDELDLTILTTDQIFGNAQTNTEPLDILKKYGVRCAVTDFCILLGIPLYEDVYTNEGPGYYNRSSSWWTKTADSITSVYVVTEDGIQISRAVNSRNISIRPAFVYTKDINLITVKKRNSFDILEIEYGEYPQTVVSKEENIILEDAFNNNEILETGKNYTIDANLVIMEYDFKKFTPFTFKEYVYNNQKYIRFVNHNITFSPYLDRECYLVDGRKIKCGEPYWVMVEPITWLLDESKQIALSKKIICTGIRFEYQATIFNGDFSTSYIKKYMDKYLANEIIPSELIINKQGNIYNLNFDKITEKDIVKGMIESDISVFLHGKSSEGKSARVKQIDPDSTIIYLRNATPESLNGKTVYNESTGEMIDIKPSWLKKLEQICTNEPEKLHILFFDEITNALPSIQGMAFNIILDREVNGKWHLPDNARIVAAGNDMTESLAANQLAEPLFNRFAHAYINTNVNDWLKWARNNKIHPEIISFVSYKGASALRTTYNGETPNADPRKWEMASHMLYEVGEPFMLRSLIGKDLTEDFCSFCLEKFISLEDILNNNYTDKDLNMKLTSKYKTMFSLLDASEKDISKIRWLVLKLGPEILSIFDNLWPNGDEYKEEIINKLKDTQDQEFTSSHIVPSTSGLRQSLLEELKNYKDYEPPEPKKKRFWKPWSKK